MAIGSFVNGVFRGMEIRDTRDNNTRVRGMEDTRFEREGERFGMDKESHELAMERGRKEMARADAAAARAAARGEKPPKYSRTRLISEIMAGGGQPAPDAAPSRPAGGGGGIDVMNAFPSSPGLSYGADPVGTGSMSPQAAMQEQAVQPAAQPMQGGQPAMRPVAMAAAPEPPQRLQFVVGQGLVPVGGVA